MNKKNALLLLLILAASRSTQAGDAAELRRMYDHWCRESSDMVHHIPVLHDLARQCSSAVEIGLRSMTSTWGILQGLAESPAHNRSYLGIDLVCPPIDTLHKAKRLTESQGVSFRFI